MSTPIKAEKTESIGKLLMKEPYTSTRFLSKQARGALDLLRPFTLTAPFVISMSIMTASLIQSGKTIPENWWIIIGQSSFTVAIVNAASNALNQATDVKGDKISKPYRPIPRGMVKAESAQSLAYILYLLALMRAVTINFWFGLFIFLIMVFTVTYSLPPRIKKYLFLNQIWIAIPRGMLGILASWSVFGDPFTPTPLIIGVIATTYLIGGMTTKDVVDIEADRKTGVRTMINTYGARKTALISFPFMFFPFTFIPIFINQNLIGSHLWPLTFLVIFSIIILYLMIKETESETLENIPAWALMYLQYIFFGLGFGLLTIYKDLLPL
jgi:4-hydroxybenzoate polyprenyltransferase